MIPVARRENITIQELENELMIYDKERDNYHCLNLIAATVWRYCDGHSTVEDIAEFIEQELEISAETDIRGLVWLALEELESCHLIKEYLREPVVEATPGVSRRKVMKQATLVGGFALGALFPMVRSLVAPEPAMALSGGGEEGCKNQPCLGNYIPNDPFDTRCCQENPSCNAIKQCV
jgi:hypothetical protein